jgi:RimJ/RimL family protein N-acetyltransferase
VIETERLVLRLPAHDDVAAVTETLRDPEVMRYIGLGNTGAFDDVVAYVARLQDQWSKDGFGRFMIVRKDDEAVIGRVGLLAWDPETWRNSTRAEIGDQAEIELGWTLARAAWGFGYATEAAAATRDWAFREVQPRRLISLIHPENEPSLSVARRIGEHFDRPITMPGEIPAQIWTF